MILIPYSLIPMRRGSAPSVNKAILIGSDDILDMGSPDQLVKKYPHQKIMRLERAVLMPGLVNVHAHLELPAQLKSIQPRSYTDWVLDLLKAKSNLRNRDYRNAAKINIDALIRSGTTTVADITTHGMSPAVLTASGIRAVFFHEIISMAPLKGIYIPLPQRSTPLSSSLVQGGLSPHAPHTVSQQALLRINEIARKSNMRLSMHVAESKEEVRLLQREKSRIEKIYQAAGWNLSWAPAGKTSIEYLQRIGLLGPNFLAVHAVNVTDTDIEIIRKSRVSIAHCPRSNNALGVGKMPLKKFLNAGITVGFGTDSLASSPTLNMWDEMRYAYRIHKKSGVTAEDTFRLATIGGAGSLGMDGAIGTLEPGKKADIIAVPLPRKNTGDIYNDLLRETESSIMTMVNGKILWNQS